MARQLRIEFPGAIYHITSRGDDRKAIFRGERDRRKFMAVLEQVIEEQRWICYAYYLIPSHSHLLIETPEGNLSSGMRQINGMYTQAFNRRHGRVGHLFQSRFKGLLVQKESYLLGLSRL